MLLNSNFSLPEMLTLSANMSAGQDIFPGRPEYAIVVPIIWILLVIIGIIGNGLVIYTLLKNGEITATNCYIINLAIADLTFVVIVVPFTAASYATPHWIFGDFICRTAIYMIYVSTIISINIFL